jgi:hypothetical protein
MLDPDTTITDAAATGPVTVSVTQRIRPGQKQRFETGCTASVAPPPSFRAIRV